jgi:hypothetical protein
MKETNMRKVTQKKDARPSRRAPVSIANCGGLIEEAHEHMLRCAGLFAIVQGCGGEMVPADDIAASFNASIARLDAVLDALRSEIEADSIADADDDIAAAAEE